MASPKREAGTTGPESGAANSPAISAGLFRIGLILRFLLFVATLASVLMMVTSKQTKEISVMAFAPMHLVAKFEYSPAYKYFVGAISVACLYSLLSALGSAIFLRKTGTASIIFFYLAFFDALMFGLVASALGAGAAIGYVGVKGNPHVGWVKICNMFDKFCRHVGASLVLSGAASILLVLLVLTSAYSLYRRSR